MSDPEDPPAPAANPPTRSLEAARRLSQLLARPLGAPAPPGEASEPYVPRLVRAVPAAAPAAEPAHDTASAPPPVAPADEPDLPWFDQPAQPAPVAEPASAPEPPGDEAEIASPLSGVPVPHVEPRAPAPADDDDLFSRRETPRDLDQPVAPPAPDRVPEWAWPSALDRAPEPAPEPRAELAAPPEPLAAPAPPEPPRRGRERAAPEEPVRAAAPSEDTTRTLGNIRRLMLVSNLFMVVAIGAVLTVVGYRLFRSEPAPPTPPPPVAAPAPAKIPVDMTLTLPRGARIIETAVAGERLVITLEIDGATEIRTFDIKTLQPTGRLSFGIVP